MHYQQKLDDIERKFDDLNGQMADPAVISDSTQYRKVSKAHNELAEIVSKYRAWKTATRNLAEARPMLDVGAVLGRRFEGPERVTGTSAQ